MKRICFILGFILVFAMLPSLVFAQDDFGYEVIDGGVEITSYKGEELEVTVPSEIDKMAVVSIGYKAFANDDMRKIVLPETIVNISDSAFLDCLFLEEVIIPEGITEIKYATFKGCTLLRKVALPSGLLKIGDDAFNTCSSLQTVGVIPKGVTEIGNGAFFRCTSLKALEVDSENPVFESEDGVIYTENKRVLWFYPAGKNDKTFTIPETVEVIASDAFEVSSLKKIVIPETVKKVGDNAFHLSSIKEVVFEGDIVLEECAFLECENLKKAVFKKDVEFGALVFDMCEKATVYADIDHPILTYAKENNLYYGYVDGEKITRPLQMPKIDWNAVIFWCVTVVVVSGGAVLFVLFGKKKKETKIV